MEMADKNKMNHKMNQSITPGKNKDCSLEMRFNRQKKSAYYEHEI